MLFNWRTRIAAASVGVVMTFLTLFLYFPLFVKALGTAQSLEELNYVGDTLLFGGDGPSYRHRCEPISPAGPD
jgi:hypothetical protein